MSITIHQQPSGTLTVSQSFCVKVSTSTSTAGQYKRLRWRLLNSGTPVTEWYSCVGTEGKQITIDAMPEIRAMLNTTLPSSWLTTSGVFQDTGAYGDFSIEFQEVVLDTTVSPCTTTVASTASTNSVFVLNGFFFVDEEFDLANPTWLSARPAVHSSCKSVVYPIGLWVPTGSWQIELYANVKTSPLSFNYTFTGPGVFHVIANPDTWTGFETARVLTIELQDAGGTPVAGIDKITVNLVECCSSQVPLGMLFLEPKGGFAVMTFDEELSRSFARRKLLTCVGISCANNFDEYAAQSAFQQTSDNEKDIVAWRKVVNRDDEKLWARALLASNRQWTLNNKTTGGRYITASYVRDGEFNYLEKDKRLVLDLVFERAKSFDAV